MTGGDIVTYAAAIGGILTIVGNFALQWKTLTISQATSAKVDVNTARTDEAAAASLANSVTLTKVITRVEDAKALSATVIQKVEGVVSKVGDVVAKVEGVADAIESVKTVTGDQAEKLLAATLAKGLAEGHVIGIVAEQQRAAGLTQQLKALNESG